MRLSTRAEYGLRVCFLLALSEEIMPLSQLVNQTNLSEKYLEQILGMLRRADLIVTKRGVNGGYKLSRPPKDITFSQILAALDDSFDLTACIKGECDDQYCPNRRFLLRLHQQIDSLLNSTTLKSMLEENSCNSAPKNPKIEDI